MKRIRSVSVRVDDDVYELIDRMAEKQKQTRVVILRDLVNGGLIYAEAQPLGTAPDMITLKLKQLRRK